MVFYWWAITVKGKEVAGVGICSYCWVGKVRAGDGVSGRSGRLVSWSINHESTINRYKSKITFSAQDPVS